ncbi:TetR/AcrR family transcriptional regulator [Clostridium sp. MD294]|uniref:TetR/AcrR family transcriptional regulator n=1 Tax=Clostridium sp. MD294 TaxID=97138 RepID=UPI0002CC3CA0|nr:TetR/AcrR family transcriptional regulator [Clostridium sp. MD294]NDO45641.1 TetR/AcrR family transcriptional regulator [Clostridium sp. MD294]USF30703.1 hypothetical protein C820_002146 [Clostridium sp. MD294]
MARPVKKTLEIWKKEILDAAQTLFLSKGFEQTSISDIMDIVGGAKGMFYHCFKSKEEVMHTLCDKMFFENNPFEKIKNRTDLNGLQKIKELLVINQSDTKRNDFNLQAMSILKDPHILASAIESNKRILTPLWFELLEEAKKDGSIKTEYTKELSEILPLINFWLIPTVYPATAEEIHHKYLFIMEVLSHMGLPLFHDKTTALAEKFIADISAKGGKKQ